MNTFSTQRFKGQSSFDDEVVTVTEINPLLLKTMSKVFSVPLAIIFQESMTSGTIPKIWKDARVTP